MFFVNIQIHLAIKLLRPKETPRDLIFEGLDGFHPPPYVNETIHYNHTYKVSVMAYY